MKVLLLALPVCLALVLAAPADAADRVPVFVTSVGAVSGFTDPNQDNQDTVKDLRNNLQKERKTLRVVETRDDALVVIVVLGREAASQGQASSLGFGLPMRDYITRVKLIASGVEAELSASKPAGAGSAGAWRKNAAQIGKQVEAWVITNQAQLARSPIGF